jgi:DNA-binding transcriptional MerR regulator
MAAKQLRTSDLARAAGIHPNTVRLYVEWGLIPPVKRSPAGHRIFTQHHLECLLLARTIYAAQYPGRQLRASGNAIIQCAAAGDWVGALAMADEYSKCVKIELELANQAATLLEHWAQNTNTQNSEERLSTKQVSKLLGVSLDAIRNWERNGLIAIPRNSYNNYRLYGKNEIERLQIIRMLSHAGYSQMAMLRMFIELDGGNNHNLRKILDTPREDEDIFNAADHWLTTLRKQEKLAEWVIQIIAKQIAQAI